MRYSWHVGVVTDTKLFGRTGDIGRWAESVENQFTRNAILEAPSSLESGRPNKSRANAAYPSGSMKANIFGEVSRVGVRQLQTLVYVDVPYAQYVIRGTGPVIFAKGARQPAGTYEGGVAVGGRFKEGKMYLPGQPRWKSRWRQWVKGQPPDNFLGRAFDRTARTHSSLSGYSMIG